MSTLILLTIFSGIVAGAPAKAPASDSSEGPIWRGPLSCPQDDGVFFSSQNKDYVLRCGKGWPDSDAPFLDAVDYASCVEKCSGYPGCLGATWDLRRGDCYLKTSLSDSYTAMDAMSALIDGSFGQDNSQEPTCLSARDDGQIYTTPQGDQYRISCDRDTASAVVAAVKRANFAQCMQACDQDADCVSVTYGYTKMASAQGNCKLRNGAQQVLQSSLGVWYAVQLRAAPDTTTTTTTTTTKPTTTTTTITTTTTKPPTATTTSTTTTTTTTTTMTTTTMPTTTTRICPTNPSTSGIPEPTPCANNTPFARKFVDDQCVEWGVCENSEIYDTWDPIPGIDGREMTFPPQVTDKAKYCAAKCSLIRGCIASTIDVARDSCVLRYKSYDIYAASHSVVMRVNPPAPGNGPCPGGFDITSTFTTASGGIFGLCPQATIRATWEQKFDSGDLSVICPETCSQSRDCVVTSWSNLPNKAGICYFNTQYEINRRPEWNYNATVLLGRVSGGAASPE